MNFFIIHTLDRRNSGWSIPSTIRCSSSGEEMDRKRRNVVVQTRRTTTIVGKKWNLSTLYWFPTRSSEFPASPGWSVPRLSMVRFRLFPSTTSDCQSIKLEWDHEGIFSTTPLELVFICLLPATVMLAVSWTTWNSGASPEISHR